MVDGSVTFSRDEFADGVSLITVENGTFTMFHPSSVSHWNVDRDRLTVHFASGRAPYTVACPSTMESYLRDVIFKMPPSSTPLQTHSTLDMVDNVLIIRTPDQTVAFDVRDIRYWSLKQVRECSSVLLVLCQDQVSRVVIRNVPHGVLLAKLKTLLGSTYYVRPPV